MRTEWFVRAYRRSLIGLVLVLAVAAVVGYVSGWLATALLVVVSSSLAVHLLGFWRFSENVLGKSNPGRWQMSSWQAIRDTIQRRRIRGRQQRRRLIATLHAYRDAAAALPDAVIALEGDTIIWFNNAAQDLLRLDRREDIGAQLIDRLSSQKIVDWLVANSGEPLNDVAAPSDREIRLSLRQIHDRRGLRLVIARDVTQLQRLEQVRRDFVANVSHELRTPLTVVHGYLDMIDPEDVPDYAPILRELRNQSRRMTEIVQDLLTLSRLDANDPASKRDRVALGPMLAILRREAEALSAGRHHVIVERDSELDLGGSDKDLHSAFSNLVSNAIRYSPEGGEIIIRWCVKAGMGRLEVVDRGPGIAAQHLPRLTERFYRVSSSRSRESGGTGLGLSIVKHVLQLHDARLEIASVVGEGSTFACVFDPSRLREMAVDDEA